MRCAAVAVTAHRNHGHVVSTGSLLVIELQFNTSGGWLALQSPTNTLQLHFQHGIYEGCASSASTHNTSADSPVQSGWQYNSHGTTGAAHQTACQTVGCSGLRNRELRTRSRPCICSACQDCKPLRIDRGCQRVKEHQTVMTSSTVAQAAACRAGGAVSLVSLKNCLLRS